LCGNSFRSYQPPSGNRKIDLDAFVVQYPVKDNKGGMIKKRPLH